METKKIWVETFLPPEHLYLYVGKTGSTILTTGVRETGFWAKGIFTIYLQCEVSIISGLSKMRQKHQIISMF